METTEKNGLEPPPEQVIYANLLLLGVWLGLAMLLVTFALYVSGVLAPHVPLEETPLRWEQGVHEYLQSTHWPSGWSWLGMLGKGDVLNYVGFVFLALLTLLGYGVLLRAYLKAGDTLFTIICILEMIVLGLAASGLLVGGGH
jgi:hypothetical protein